MRDENPIRTLGDYSKPSYEGYRNTIELPVENNVKGIDYATRGRLRKLSPDEAWAIIERLAQYEDEGWNDALTPDEMSLNFENPDIKQLLGIMDCKVNALMMDAILLMGKSESVFRLTTNEIYQPPSEPLQVARRLKQRIKENENKPRKIKKIIKYLDTKPEESQVNEPDVGQEEKGNLENINSNRHPQPDPLASIATEQVRKMNSMLESLGLVPQSSNTKFVCSKEDDGEVMFIEIIRTMMNLKMRVPMKVKGQQRKDQR
ncbi:hypothetical protein Tco_0532117 [Tanacetum coccineum]